MGIEKSPGKGSSYPGFNLVTPKYLLKYCVDPLGTRMILKDTTMSRRENSRMRSTSETMTLSFLEIQRRTGRWGINGLEIFFPFFFKLAITSFLKILICIGATIYRVAKSWT